MIACNKRGMHVDTFVWTQSRACSAQVRPPRPSGPSRTRSHRRRAHERSGDTRWRGQIPSMHYRTNLNNDGTGDPHGPQTSVSRVTPGRRQTIVYEDPNVQNAYRTVSRLLTSRRGGAVNSKRRAIRSPRARLDVPLHPPPLVGGHGVEQNGADDERRAAEQHDRRRRP